MERQDTATTAAPVRKPTTSITFCSPQMVEALAEISLLAFSAERDSSK